MGAIPQTRPGHSACPHCRWWNRHTGHQTRHLKNCVHGTLPLTWYTKESCVSLNDVRLCKSFIRFFISASSWLYTSALCVPVWGMPLMLDDGSLHKELSQRLFITLWITQISQSIESLAVLPHYYSTFYYFGFANYVLPFLLLLSRAWLPSCSHAHFTQSPFLHLHILRQTSEESFFKCCIRLLAPHPHQTCLT